MEFVLKLKIYVYGKIAKRSTSLVTLQFSHKILHEYDTIQEFNVD